MQRLPPSLLDLGHPGLRQVSAVEIVVTVHSVIVFHLSIARTNIAVPPREPVNTSELQYAPIMWSPGLSMGMLATFGPLRLPRLQRLCSIDLKLTSKIYAKRSKESQPTLQRHMIF